MNSTIDQLAKSLGCEKIPDRWREFYDEVVAEHSRVGCYLAKPEYYDELSQKYTVLERHKEIYKKAAMQVAQTPDLSLFLALLCRALEDRAVFRRDLASLCFPKPQNGEDRLAYDMLPGLAMCQAIPVFYDYMKKRALPDDIIYPSLCMLEDCVDSFIRRNGGREGFADFDWYQLYYDARLYRIEGLNMEFPATFPGIATVYQNSDGEIVSLATNIKCHREGFPLGSKYYEDEEGYFTATLEETSDAYIGHPYTDRGLVSKEKISLKKSEWSKVFSGGDKMISIHIPTGAKFTPEAIDHALERTSAIVKDHFPEYDYKLFFCGSWMLDPQVVDLLGENKNISKFCRRFHPLYVKSAGRGVFTFVFQKAYNAHFEISELPENTSLERALKKHYMSGKAIYETFGFFLP